MAEPARRARADFGRRPPAMPILRRQQQQHRGRAVFATLLVDGVGRAGVRCGSVDALYRRRLEGRVASPTAARCRSQERAPRETCASGDGWAVGRR
ncbi:hypothetical protein HPB50_011762 [Hyalomma asiaticum]|uniref:Uncharacterized protein n=1 Tax=Hyalomma asiaticum TaxID=266040 RepID=A0ACB7TJ12_HYAAI|nr:hypothetical protein HPB50_011762 [Hyalomma asiaticum]